MGESTRQETLKRITDTVERDEFIVIELDRIDERLAGKIEDFRTELRDLVIEVRDEMRDRDDKTNKRITVMQGTLIAVLASTTGAAVVWGF